MSRRNNAEQMLGVMPNTTPEEISKAFQARVSELTQKQLSPNDFQNQLNQLYAAHDLLTKPRQEVSIFDSPFGSFGYIDNYMKQMQREMQREMDDIFDRHHRQAFDAHHQQLQNPQPQMIQEQQGQQGQQEQQLFGQQQVQQQVPQQNQQQPYKYVRSFNKSLKVDQNGNVVGTSNKLINDNGRTFREEKQFDSAANKMHIKRYKPDGSVNEFEKPYPNKSNKRYLGQN